MRLSGSTARAEMLPGLPARPGPAVVVRDYSLKLSVAQSLAQARPQTLKNHGHIIRQFAAAVPVAFRPRRHEGSEGSRISLAREPR